MADIGITLSKLLKVSLGEPGKQRLLINSEWISNGAWAIRKEHLRASDQLTVEDVETATKCHRRISVCEMGDGAIDSIIKRRTDNPHVLLQPTQVGAYGDKVGFCRAYVGDGHVRFIRESFLDIIKDRFGDSSVNVLCSSPDPKEWAIIDKEATFVTAPCRFPERQLSGFAEVGNILGTVEYDEENE